MYMYMYHIHLFQNYLVCISLYGHYLSTCDQIYTRSGPKYIKKYTSHTFPMLMITVLDCAGGRRKQPHGHHHHPPTLHQEPTALKGAHLTSKSYIGIAQSNFERLSPPGGVGANAEPAWSDPSSVSWSSSGDRLFHCFSRLALRSHQGLARTYGPEDEGGPHCCPDTQVLHLENDQDGGEEADGDSVTVVGQDRHD